MGTIILNKSEFCYNNGPQQMCIIQGKDIVTHEKITTIMTFPNVNNTNGKEMDGTEFKDKLNAYLTKMKSVKNEDKKYGFEVVTEKCNPKENMCEINVDFSKVFF